MHGSKYSIYSEFGLLVNEKNGMVNKLGGYEMKLLETLMLYPDKVFSRDYLLAIVWHPKIVTQGCLSKTIHSLRSALGDYRPWSIIKTHQRQGISITSEIVACIDIKDSKSLPDYVYSAIFKSDLQKH